MVQTLKPPILIEWDQGKDGEHGRMRLQVPPPVSFLGFRKTIFIIILNKSGLYVFGKIKETEYTCEDGKIFKYFGC